MRRGLLSNGVMANQIYVPSYVSEDFALSHHGLIPEMPVEVTSVAMGVPDGLQTRLASSPIDIAVPRRIQSVLVWQGTVIIVF